jgi:RNA polymerase sigma-70 factor (ECF subfamily)
MAQDHELPPGVGGSPAFCTTRWSTVLNAGQGDPEARAAALERLCTAYWFPVYLFVRRKGYAEAEAKDLTQEFFARLIEKNFVGDADPSRGRFRTFLRAAIQHFLANEWNRANCLKRGGGSVLLSLDEADAEGRYLRESIDGLTPELLFERKWAQTVVENVLRRLEADARAGGRLELFLALRPYLTAEPDAPAYATVAGQVGMSEPAVKSAIHRLRLRSREVFREEIRQTVEAEGDVDEEVQALFRALRG